MLFLFRTLGLYSLPSVGDSPDISVFTYLSSATINTKVSEFSLTLLSTNLHKILNSFVILFPLRIDHTEDVYPSTLKEVTVCCSLS